MMGVIPKLVFLLYLLVINGIGACVSELGQAYDFPTRRPKDEHVLLSM